MPETTVKTAQKRVRAQSKAQPMVDTQLADKPAQNPVKPAENKLPAKIGRPTNYNENIALVICIRLANGEALKQITTEVDMPAQSTVYSWLLKFPEFTEMYARAREEQADSNADEVIAISDEEPRYITDSTGKSYVDSGWVAHQRNRMEARKWTAMKLKPRKYGDRVAVEGVEGGAPINSNAGVDLMLEVIRNMEMSKRLSGRNRDDVIDA